MCFLNICKQKIIFIIMKEYLKLKKKNNPRKKKEEHIHNIS